MAIESVVSDSFQLDLFGVVVRAQTVKKKAMSSNLDTKSDIIFTKYCGNYKLAVYDSF
jgi:hypothetical protein